MDRSLGEPACRRALEKAIRGEEQVVGRFASLISGLNRVAVWLGGAGIVVMTLLITVEVVIRRLFNISTFIADEMSAYLLVLVTFMGLGYTLKEGGHIQVRMVVDRLSSRTLAGLRLGWCLLGLSYCGLLAYQAWRLTADSYRMKAVAVTVARTPLFLPQSAIVIGLGLLMLQLLVEAVSAGRSLGHKG